MGKGTDLLRELQSGEPTAPRPDPQLRLNADILARSISPDSTTELLDQVEGDNLVAVVHNAEQQARAVVVPAELYLELVTSYIRDRNLMEAQLDGRIVPPEATLAELGVEQVDPRQTWIYTGGDTGG